MNQPAKIDPDENPLPAPRHRSKAGDWITTEDEKKCRDCASAAVIEIERKMQLHYGKGKILSRLAKKRLRKSLTHSVIQSLQHQGVI